MADAYLYRIDYAVTTNSDLRDAHQIVSGDPAVPVDLTDSVFESHFRRSATDLYPLLVASTANSRQVADSDGKLAWDIDAETLAQIGPGVLVYDRIWTRADGSIVPFATGTLTITLGVTR